MGSDDSERTNVATPTIKTVEFIDFMAEAECRMVDTRVMDFALDVRTLLSTDFMSDTKDPRADRRRRLVVLFEHGARRLYLAAWSISPLRSATSSSISATSPTSIR